MFDFQQNQKRLSKKDKKSRKNDNSGTGSGTLILWMRTKYPNR
jgi:hypothetical protein